MVESVLAAKSLDSWAQLVMLASSYLDVKVTEEKQQLRLLNPIDDPALDNLKSNLKTGLLTVMGLVN